jgi:hypothetical protein
VGSLKRRFRLGDCTNRYGLTQCAGACTCSRTHARANLMVVVGLLVLTFLLPPQISCLLWFVCFISPTLLFLLGGGMCVLVFFFLVFCSCPPTPFLCWGDRFHAFVLFSRFCFGVGMFLLWLFRFCFVSPSPNICFVFVWGRGAVLCFVVSFFHTLFCCWVCFCFVNFVLFRAPPPPH